MIAEKHIRHYNALHRNKISKKALTKFHAALKKDIESGRIDAHVPYGVELLDIEKRLANGLKKINGHVMVVAIDKPIKIRLNGEALPAAAFINMQKKGKLWPAKRGNPHAEEKRKTIIVREDGPQIDAFNVPQKRKHKGPLNPLQMAQLKDAIKAGRTPKVNLKAKMNAKKTNAPLFEPSVDPKQASLFGSKKGKMKGVVKASSLAGIEFTNIPLNTEFKKDFERVNSDSVLMIWGLPGSGKTYKLLKLAKYLGEQNRKPLFISEEEFGRSTFAEKLKEINIGDQVDFAPHIDESLFNQYDTIFLDSVNSMGLGPKDIKRMMVQYPGKLWILIVQTTKEGDFRGGQDWEHLVDIAGEVVNRKVILRKNRLDPNNKKKADKLRVDEIVAEKQQAEEIKQLVKAKTDIKSKAT